jgi:hypothetical protein
MHKGDLVFIYESKTGRSEIITDPNGNKSILKRHEGREGVVCLSEIIKEPYEDEESEPSKYVDGTKIWWRYFSDLKPINSHGFIPRRKVNEIMGYREGYIFRGFGTNHSGIKEITNEKFQSMLKVFTFNNIEEEKDLKEKREPKFRHDANQHPLPEGEVHKKIKSLIANNPQLLLDEAGLKLIRPEYPFDTNDRVDILLRDQYGRFVVVEIKSECEKGNHLGSAQCMKYRALMSFEYDRKETEVRAILVALRISDDVVEKARRYGIETKEIKLNS